MCDNNATHEKLISILYSLFCSFPFINQWAIISRTYVIHFYFYISGCTSELLVSATYLLLNTCMKTWNFLICFPNKSENDRYRGHLKWPTLIKLKLIIYCYQFCLKHKKIHLCRDCGPDWGFSCGVKVTAFGQRCIQFYDRLGVFHRFKMRMSFLSLCVGTWITDLTMVDSVLLFKLMIHFSSNYFYYIWIPRVDFAHIYQTKRSLNELNDVRWTSTDFYIKS